MVVTNTFVRLFFALLPPAGVIGEIARHRAACSARRPVADERLHVTLLLLGEWLAAPPWLLRRVGEAMTTAPLTACRLVFDRIVVGTGSALLTASEPLRGVERLRRQLGHEAIGLGFAPNAAWRSRPHVTLGYDGVPAPARAIEPISWQAGALALVESRVGLTEHRMLARWPLPG